MNAMKKVVTGLVCLAAGAAGATNFYWCGAGEPNADGSRNWEDPTNWLVNGTIVYGNTTKGAAAEIGGVAGYADCFENCLIGVDPQLRGKGAKAYRPMTASPCIDAGLTLDWMTDALDVYGQPRVQGEGAVKKPDIGAAEYRPSGFNLWVK